MVVSAFFENILSGARAKKIPLAEALSRMRDAGLETVYVGRDSVAEFGDGLLSLLEPLNLKVEGLHGWFDFGADSAAEDWKEFIDTASRWGAKHVLFVPGLIENPEEKPRRMENMVSSLKKAVAYGREKGIAVTMENLDQITAPYNCAEGLRWFFSRVEGLQCCFDTGNFVIHKENELALLDEFLSNVRAVHVKDRSKVKLHPKDAACICGDGSVVYPAPVGDGCMQIPAILNRLKDAGYEGSLIAELYGCDEDYQFDAMVKSVEWLKSHIGK